MQHAVEAPGLKLAVVGGAALALALGARAMSRPQAAPPHLTVHRLSLHAPVMREALYLTAWSMGDVFVARDDAHPSSIVFQTKAELNDGCVWLATETLTPVDQRTYAYQYDETILSCEAGVVPYELIVPTPRIGTATVED